jgi:hypothetical protein
VNAAGDQLQDTARQAALALPDVSHGYPFTPELDVYKVAGKVFLIVTDDPIITLKCEPKRARAHERDYASITYLEAEAQAGTPHFRSADGQTQPTSARRRPAANDQPALRQWMLLAFR